MKPDDIKKLRLEMEKQALIRIREHFPQFIDDYEDALEEHNSDEKEHKFSYQLSLNFKMTCEDPSRFHIGSKIGNSIKRITTGSGTVMIGEDLVTMMEKAESEAKSKTGEGMKPEIEETMISNGPQVVDLDDPASERPPYPPKKKPGRPPKKAAPRTAPKSPVKPIPPKGDA